LKNDLLKIFPLFAGEHLHLNFPPVDGEGRRVEKEEWNDGIME
jgi:hypothetical protein